MNDEIDASEKLLKILNLDYLDLKEILQTAISGMEKTAKILQKENPQLLISEVGKCIPREFQEPLTQIFNHLFNNSLDHSIESSEERKISSKSSFGTITIKVLDRLDQLDFSFFDDGRGVDIKKLIERASAINYPFSNVDSLLGVIFSDGLSTKDKVSIVSGRGVGMNTIKKLVESLGGHFEVTSFSNATLESNYAPIIFRFRIPYQRKSINQAS